MKRSEKLLDAFSRWFASSPGVWQTVAILGGWVALEYAHVVHDQSMFQLMAWCTIYSVLTQPVLAYVGTLAGKKLDQVLAHLTASSDADLAEDQAHTVLLDQAVKEIRALRAEVAELRAGRGE